MRVPVTILTGFLGSGKTTLLNHILEATRARAQSDWPKRIGIIENEFAAAFGIENEILHQDKAEDIQSLYEFGWGCVCCSSSGELINALVEIASRNEQVEPEKRIDHVILETTGLADPGPVLRMIERGADGKGTDDIVRHFFVDGIVTLVDSKHFFSRLKASSQNDAFKNEPLAQIQTSDAIILNKTDLVEDTRPLIDFIRQHNPDARVTPTTYGRVGPDAIFHLRHGKRFEPNDQTDRTHDPSVQQTMLLITDAPVDKARVEAMIQTWAGLLGDKLYRIKGVLAFKDDPSKYVVQGVGADVTITRAQPWNDDPRDSRLTFIGKDVEEAGKALEDDFQACVVKE